MGFKIRPKKYSALLSELCEFIPGAKIVGNDVAIKNIQDDSRHIKSGDLFVCVKGLLHDGHEYANKALSAGASALVVEKRLDVDPPQLVVKNGAIALGLLAAHRHGHPTEQICPIGITGTNGKTTTTYIVESILRAANQRPGVIGTVNYRYGGKTYPAPFTTPTSLVLQNTLSNMISCKSTHALLEVSSAALDMHRLSGTSFEVAAFTNLTQDHLDVHKTMAAYKKAKAKLFKDHLAPKGTAVIHMDSPASSAMINALDSQKLIRVTSTSQRQYEIRVRRKRFDIQGIEAVVDTPRGPINIQCGALLGDFNLHNIVLAIGIAEALQLPQAAIEKGISTLQGVPGRLERVKNKSSLDIFVDYAHTPDALENLLTTLKPLTEKKLIAIFGAGGDRDKGKRPLMGRVAKNFADKQYVTSDNPRSESPKAILDDIQKGIPNPTDAIVDRETAIHSAIAHATPGDVIAIAGKGHEDYQVLANETIHFDDREVASEACRSRTAYPMSSLAKDCLGTLSGKKPQRVTRISIDGRQAAPGDLYVAIRGERFDGHDYCGQAYEAGVRSFLVSKEIKELGLKKDASVIRVEDTRLALGQIAAAHRKTWNKPIIGVTGSAGKTTTVQLISAMLGHIAPTHATRGSLNNETGVPLTLLGLLPIHHFGVIEMGMRGLGQIRYLSNFAKPNIAVVTNIGTAHIGVVGSLENIVKAKSEIYENLGPKGIAIYPADNSALARSAVQANQSISFGFNKSADIRITKISTDHKIRPVIHLDVMGTPLSFPFSLLGKHNALNAACAIAVALATQSDLTMAAEGLSQAKPPSMRGEIIRVADRNIILDCYNANPEAMKHALETLLSLADTATKPTAILGDMLELGDSAHDAHYELGTLCGTLGIRAIALGEHAQAIVKGAKDTGGEAILASDPRSASQAILKATYAKDWLLIKASRGMRLERVVDALVSIVPNKN